MEKIKYIKIKSPAGFMFIAVSKKGLCKISISGKTDKKEEFFCWLKKFYPKAELEKVEEEDLPAIKEIREYFKGELKSFTTPLDLKGTEFQLKVWNALQKIPYGEKRTYKEVAEITGNPKASRAVGGANRRNPVPLIIPCHRVIGADGTMKGYGGKECIPVKEFLLKLEGAI